MINLVDIATSNNTASIDIDENHQSPVSRDVYGERLEMIEYMESYDYCSDEE